MIIAKLSQHDCDQIAMIVANNDQWDEVLIAFDPIDQAFKFKINQGTWTPPIGTFQPPDFASSRSWWSNLLAFGQETITKVRGTIRTD